MTAEVYLDHAATSWPKPAVVLEAIAEFLESAGGNVGRAGHHRSIASSRAVSLARERLTELLGAETPDQLVFTKNATEGLKSKLKSTFGWDDATAYAHIGISGMNGLSDQQELTSPGTWTQIRDWANSHHIARLAFWSVNRDRPCPGGGVVSNCSGISQSNWQFTSITAGFTG